MNEVSSNFCFYDVLELTKNTCSIYLRIRERPYNNLEFWSLVFIR